MISWKSFRKWARSKGYDFIIQGSGDEAITGVADTPIATGSHNHSDGVPDRLLQEIAYHLGKTKRALEDEIG